MLLETKLSQPSNDADTCTLTTPVEPGYTAFSGAFGGWTAAHALTAAMPFCREVCEPISITTDFLKGIATAAGADGELPTVRSTAHLLSAGSSAQFVRIETFAADTLTAHTSVVFARRRDTTAIAGATMPQCPLPETLSTFTYPSSPVTWIDRFDTRFVQGVPLRPNAHLRSVAWVRFADQLRPFDTQCLVALADANLPRIYFHFSKPTPIATASMTVQIHAPKHRLAAVGHDFVLMDAYSNAASHGYFDQTVRIWARDGTLLASSVQMVRYSDAAG
jgi:acyl-CoA thioesterase